MPQLVIANAPKKAYPGGVVAVRATDWLAGSRGTLTTESDALASTGECVRDAQKITVVTDPLIDETDDFPDADATLELPVDDLGLPDDRDYFLWVTYKVDGDWDSTNEPILQRSSNHVFNHVGAIGITGTGETSFPDMRTRLIGHTESYGVLRLFPGAVATGDVIVLKAFTQTGIPADILIDQLLFVPFAGTQVVGYQEVPGAIAGETAVALDDGTDGGDDSGKFTFKDLDAVNQFENNMSSSDYQRYADPDDAEWNVQLTEATNLPLETSLGAPFSAPGYSLHVVRHEPFVTVDDYDNRSTTVDTRDMGVSADGYGYGIDFSAQLLSPVAYVDSGVGIMRIRQGAGVIGVQFADPTQSISALNNNGAEFQEEAAWIWSGLVEHTAGVLGGANARWRFLFNNANIEFEVRVNLVAKTWRLRKTVSGTPGDLGSLHDISAWFGLAAPLGFKIEVKRYVIRVRVWDASGAEPSTWDEELFKDVRVGATDFAYPYSDVLTRAQQGYNISFQNEFNFTIESTTTGNTLPYDVTLHEMALEKDTYGDPEPMTAYLEQPEGTVVGQQVIPYGCPHFVYWGSRIWTEPSGASDRLSFSSKLLNDTTAAELQRAEGTIYFFVATEGGIVSMNWSSAQPADITRVHA